jgi:hypothetical protein
MKMESMHHAAVPEKTNEELVTSTLPESPSVRIVTRAQVIHKTMRAYAKIVV